VSDEMEDMWKPIETAPVDKKIIMGWWITYNLGWSEDAKLGYPDRLCWKSHVGVAKKTKGLGPFKMVKYTPYGQDATHWIELPEPPQI
jgi:hypothetical protein